MARVHVEIDDRRLRRVLAKAKNVPQAAARALYEEGQVIFNKSQELVPVETGALAGSGRVTLPSVNASSVEVEIGYGGAAAPYAIYVHERLDLNHRYPGAKNARAQAKFLEQPVLEAAPKLGDRLADRVEGLLR